MTNVHQAPQTESEIQFCIDRNLEGLHPWQIHLLEQLDKSLTTYREATIPTLGGNNNTSMKAGYKLHDNPYGLNDNDSDIHVMEISISNLSPFGEIQLAEDPMSKIKNIETVTLIRGMDASKMSDDAILDMISDLEAQITRYADMTTTTKTAEKKVAALKADIKALVAFVDGDAEAEADA